MPIYEYACAKCESEFEVEQRITEDPIKTCPTCRSRRVKRLISQTSFTLKGGGWYADGYASKHGRSSGDSASSDKPSSDKSSADSAASDTSSADRAASDKSAADSGDKGKSKSKGKEAVA